MKYGLELIEEIGNDHEKELISITRVGTVECPSIQSVAGVARAIASGYYEEEKELTTVPKFRHKFSVLVREHLSQVKVVQCYSGMTIYYQGDKAGQKYLSAGY